MIFEFLALIPFYFLGAFPTGTLVARSRGVNIVEVGSGNVGATNIARSLGKKAGVITLAIDVLKGILATWLAHAISDSLWFAELAAVAAVFGHCFSIPGKFKGGKGVATALGTIIYLSPVAAIGAVLIFTLVFLLSRIVSLASVAATLSTPILVLLLEGERMTLGPIVIIALVVASRHRKNLQRLARGEEPRFSFAKS